MNTPLSQIVGPREARRLVYTRQRPPGQVNDVLNATELLITKHAEFLHHVWSNLPFHAQCDAEAMILELGEAAQELKTAARRAMREGGKYD